MGRTTRVSNAKTGEQELRNSTSKVGSEVWALGMSLYSSRPGILTSILFTRTD